MDIVVGQLPVYTVYCNIIMSMFVHYFYLKFLFTLFVILKDKK